MDGYTGYISAEVIVEGAVDDTKIFAGAGQEGDLREYLMYVEAAAEDDGLKTQVYIMRHEHPMWEDEQCQCIQFETDLKPAHTFPK